MLEKEATQTKDVSNAANAEAQKPLESKVKDAGVDTEKVVGERDTDAGQETSKKRTYTEDEVRDLLQREADKRVTEAQKTLQKKIDALKTEIEMSKLTEEEKAKALSKQKESELLEKEREIAKREADFSTMKLLADEKMPTELLAVFEGVQDLDKRIKGIRLFKEIYNKAVSDYQNEKEKGTFHLAGGQKRFSKEEIKKMTPKQINELFNKDPSLLLGEGKKT